MEASFWKDKPVLITGNEGFIGGYLKKALETLNAKVHAFDLKSGNDLRSLAEIEKKLDQAKPEIIFHLAAITQVTDAEKDMANTYATNIGGTLNLCKACMERNIPIIVASSDKVYGNTGRRWAYENAKLRGLQGAGIYTRSKAVMDILVRELCENGLQAVVTRSANVYGFGDNNVKRIIPGILADLEGKTFFKLRTHGRQLRTYIHVEDVTRAYLHVAYSFLLRKIPTGTVVNFSSEEVYSAAEICKLATQMFAVEENRFFSDHPTSDNGEIQMQCVAEANLTYYTGYQCRNTMESFWQGAAEKIKVKKQPSEK